MLRLLPALLFLALAPPALAQDRAAGPIVVELFTSQGCESCPRANRLMGRLNREPDVIALTYPVDVWDYLGWRDTFARPEFTQRQRAYSRAMEVRSIFTPQLIFNGARGEAGARPDRIRDVILELRGEHAAHAPAVTVIENARGMRVHVGRGAHQSEPADVWVASYEPGPVWADINGGENAGLRVPHYNLVRRIARLGEWSGAPVTFNRTACRPACAVIVQAHNGGPVLAAARGPARHDDDEDDDDSD